MAELNRIHTRIPARSTRTTRRTFLLAGGVSLILPGSRAFAQDSPPIEPIEPDGQTPIGPDATETPDVTWEDDQPKIEPRQTPEDGENDVDYSSTQYFAESGHNLETPFLSAWQEAGGEAVLGIPLSEARFVAGAGIQQTFATITLWYAPDDAGETEVTGFPIDPEKIPSLAPASAQRAMPTTIDSRDGQFFERTGHGISGKIAAFWHDIDGNRFLGAPLSREYEAAGVTRQLFECGMVEIGTDGRARLAHLMQDTLLDEATLGSEAFVPAPPTLGVTSLVTAGSGLKLRAGPGATSTVRTVIANNAEFIAAPGEHGAWVPGYADGQSGWVSAEYLTAPQPLPVVNMTDWNLSVWQGATLSDTNLRKEPSTRSRAVRTLTYGSLVTVVRWVEGEAVIDDDDAWAELDDGTFAYVRNLGRSAPVQAPALPSGAPTSGRWIDVHLTQQLMVAYEDRTVKRVSVMTSGRPGWDTPEGMFAINTRVPNETMESGSIGAESFYKLEDVLYTQYFTDVGHALHFAWWKTPETIGRPGSHGCLNLLLEEAKFYWDWATIGTPVFCHF